MAYIRLKDIAERANVSVNTVSRALKGRNDIGIATQNRIKKIADEMGYIPDASASRLRSKTHKMIGVIITHIDNSFYSRILQGINDAVATMGYAILALSSGEDLDQESSLVRTLGANRVSGMIIVPSRDMINTLDYDRLGIPHIMIVRKGNFNTGSYFINDSYKSGRLVAEYFLQNERRNPAYLGFNLPVTCNQEREAGFLDTFSSAGFPVSENHRAYCTATEKAAYKATTALLIEDNRIDALFVYNDLMAIGALKAIRDQGLRIPDDISIIGHDDIAAAPYLEPPLSSIRVPKYRLGYESAQELVALIGDPDFPERRIIYDPELVIRES